MEIIADKIYYEPYKVKHCEKTYLMQICPYCDKVFEWGFEAKRMGFSQAPEHHCKLWVDDARRKLGVIEKELNYKGFIIKENKEISEYNPNIPTIVAELKKLDKLLRRKV